MSDIDYTTTLNAIRDSLVQKRREASTTYDPQDTHEPMVVFYQRQIDAVDRAIADEKDQPVARVFNLDFL